MWSLEVGNNQIMTLLENNTEQKIEAGNKSRMPNLNLHSITIILVC